MKVGDMRLRGVKVFKGRGNQDAQSASRDKAVATSPSISISIRGRLLRGLLVWAVLWGLVVAGAVWLAVKEEVDELLDDSLQTAAESLIGPFARALSAIDTEPARSLTQGAGAANSGRFVWQMVNYQHGATVQHAAPRAPATPLHATPQAGFFNVAGWRVYGLPLGHDSEMLYVAQTREERTEAQMQIAFAELLAGLPMALLALLWLSGSVRRELKPLQALSTRLQDYDPLRPGATLGVAAHEELRPVQAAIDALAARLARRVANERAFSAHAAHALRTPLAGIDAQLAVALREAEPGQRPRLQRVRAAAGRLKQVVAALLALFRSGADVQRLPLDLALLAERLPVEGLTLRTSGRPVLLLADVELLSAALLNLFDNALQHGATVVTLSIPAAGQLLVQDNGRGAPAARRRALQQALDAQDYEGRTGLGLALADLVARAHGGRLELPQPAAQTDAGAAAAADGDSEHAPGFAVLLHLGADGAGAP